MPNRSWLWLFVLASVVAFGFQGTRGLTDPDEGRYCEVAREMLTSGDFLHPQLDGFPHYTKPPLTYWSLAASMAVCGQNEWAARLFQSLSYLATILLVAASGSALFGAGVGVLAVIVYATMALPFVAANIITTDTLLTLWEALAVFAFIRGRSATGPSARRLWPALCGLAFGLAFFTKGPPGLLFLAALLIYTRLPVGRHDRGAPLLDGFGILLLLGVGLWWFLYLALTTKGITSYFLGDEVVGRLAGEHHRNSGLMGAVKVYLPILALGTLPWSATWIPAWRRLRKQAPELVRFWQAWRHRPALTMLVLLILVPLFVFTLSRSRLPLYVLPLFIPIALLTARALQLAFGSVAEDLTAFRLRSRWGGGIAVWILVLLALRLIYAYWPDEANARALHDRLPVGRADEIVVTDGVRAVHGLGFYDRRELKYAAWTKERATKRGWSTVESMLQDLETHPTQRDLFLVTPKAVDDLKSQLEERGLVVETTVEGKKIVGLLCGSRRP